MTTEGLVAIVVCTAIIGLMIFIGWFKGLVSSQATLEASKAQLQAALAASEAARADDVNRLNIVITSYKNRLKQAETELESCTDPSKRAQLLRDLFS